MILIPEIEIIAILVPRTGSGALRRAIKAKYPRSTLLYRHMEADGVPAGYDRWPKVGVVRDPVDRLWSLYKFLREFDGDHDPAFIRKMRSSVRAFSCFDEWVRLNDIPFTTPYDSTGAGRFWPEYTCRHPLPENRKSQFIYLRPDLGTTVINFSDKRIIEGIFGVSLNEYRTNTTAPDPVPRLSDEGTAYMRQWFDWDFAATST